MKLYHGSPKRLKILRPLLAKGLTKFENQKAVFLCKTFRHAALYAIGKTLKGKTSFALIPKRLIVVGDKKPRWAYVYEVDVEAKIGPRGQFAYGKSISNFKVSRVNPKDYNKSVVCVENIKELKRRMKDGE